jgi:uncharacterized RDD family membrane protein YckC
VESSPEGAEEAEQALPAAKPDTPNQTSVETQPPLETALRRVSFARRIVAGLADLLILGLVGAVELAAGAFFLDLRFPPAALAGVAAFLLLVALVLLVLVPFVWGTTPGMALADLRVIASDGGSPALTASFLRFLGFILTGMLGGVPLLVAAFDRQGRTLADLFSGTSLVAASHDSGSGRAI